MAKNMPKGYAYLADQLKRAAVSSVCNLAEGNSKTSLKDRRRFFDISLGSIAEICACLDLLDSLDLDSFSSSSLILSLKKRYQSIYSMIFKLK
ncbi:MAG: four helix bundle protein [Pseudomonadota bacterium]